MLAPKGIQAEHLPEFAAQPASAPLPRPTQRHLRESDAHDGQIIIVAEHRRILFREERDLLRRVIVLAEEIDCLAPRSLLPAIEFAKVKHMPLSDTTIVKATVFDHTPVEVLFAIFDSFCATQEHDGC
jgi:hypothetical protein